jgi:peroxiredoxin
MAVTSTMLPLGTPAPPFELPDPTGARFGTQAAAAAPGLLVAFVCNHCPYVVHVAPTLGRLAAGWIDRGLVVLAVNSNDAAAYPADAPDKMPAFAEANGWTFPYLVDETQQVGLAYRAACTPDFFLFGSDGRLTYRGRLDSSRPRSGNPVTGDELGAAVDAVLSGRPAPTAQHPSMGCNVKWKPGNEPDWFGP